MKSTSNRPALYSLIAVFLAAAIYLQHVIDRPDMRHEFEPKLVNVNNAVQQLPIEFALGAATGFREAIAGLLWVRTDEFFDQGDYDAIIPMVRIITWLDPHDTDVYATGAWHMDYNFTDAYQRSDRRYIPVSIALLEEGIANNPNDIPLYADLAFTHEMRKVEDYPAAVYWYQQGMKAIGGSPSDYETTLLGHGLAHAYLAAGETDKAIAQWKWCVDQHEAAVKANPDISASRSDLASAQRNLNENILRKKWRATMVKPPLNVNFDVTVTRIAPMVLMVTGHAKFIGSKQFVLETGKHVFGPIDGCRVEVRLVDADYKVPAHEGFGLGREFDPTTTIMQDQISIRNGEFHKRIDMSKDHTGYDAMYPLTKSKYKLTVWFEPSNQNDAPEFVADRIGVLGEGLALNQPNIDLDGDLPGTPPSDGQDSDHIKGLHLLKKTITLTRQDILDPGLATFH